MTSKNLFFKLMGEDLKRRLWVVALISLGCFFVFPVAAAFMAGSIEEAVTYEKGLMDYTTALLRTVAFDNGFTVFGVVVAALICGLSSFSYLNSRSKVDFYHGIPVRREKLFAANYLNGILMMAVPYGICLAMAVAVGISNGVSGSLLWQTAGTAYVLHLIYYILMYATVVIAAMMTGNLVVGFLGSMVFAFVIPAAVSVVQGYFVTFYSTYVPNDEFLPYRVGLRLSPLTEYITQIDRYGDQPTVWLAAFGALAVSAVLALVGCWLYRKRPSEAAGRAMAFAASRPVINVILTTLSALGMGAFFWQMRRSMGWAVFGILCGAVICHSVVEIIYHFDFKKLFADRLQLAGCIAVSLAVLCVFRYDLTGYDRWVPSAGSVKCAAIDVSLLDNWVSYSSPRQDENGLWLWDRMSTGGYVLENMQCQDVENILQIAEDGVRQVELNKEAEKNGGNYGDAGASSQDTSVSIIGGADGPTSVFLAAKLVDQTEDNRIQNWSQVTIYYTMNSGRKVYRTYHLCLEDVLPQMERLMADQQFQQGIYPVMKRTADQVAVVRYREGSVQEILDTLTAEQKKELLTTYQKEFAGLTMTQMYSQAPVGLIRFTSELEEEAMDWFKWRNNLRFEDDPYLYSRMHSYSWRYGYYGDGDNLDYYPVYPSFTKTLGLLKTYQVEAGSYFAEQEVAAIRVLEYRDEYTDEYGTWHGEPVTVMFTDPEEIRQLLAVLVDGRRTYYNPLYQSENLEVTLTLADRDETIYDALFPKGKVPAFVRARLDEAK